MSPSEAAEIEWYIARNGEQHGPISTDQLRELYATQKLAQTDQLWMAEFDNWMPVSEVLGPPPAPPKPRAPPPPPPMPAPRPAEAYSPAQLAPQYQQPPATAPRETSQLVTQTVVESGSFKFSTFLLIALGLAVPLWPITLPLCWYLAYRSYKKPSTQTVRVVTQHQQ